MRKDFLEKETFEAGRKQTVGNRGHARLAVGIELSMWGMAPCGSVSPIPRGSGVEQCVGGNNEKGVIFLVNVALLLNVIKCRKF